MKFETPGDDRSAVVNSAMESVRFGLTQANGAETLTAIDSIIANFTFHEGDQKPALAELNNETLTIQFIAQTETPADYFLHAVSALKSESPPALSAIVPAERVLGTLQNQDFNFGDALTTFTESGLREALFSKENLIIALGGRMPPQKDVPPEEQLAKSQNIDEILLGPALKSPDQSDLHAALYKLYQMFFILEHVVRASADVRYNIIRGIRA